MTYTEQAIREATEKGGWKLNWYFSHFSDNEVVFGNINNDSEDNPCYYKNVYEILLDTSFWLALGKARWWEKRMTYYNSFLDGKENNDTWRLEWHRFIDHLAEGKDIESFFKQLLS